MTSSGRAHGAGLLVDLSHLGLLAVSGADATSFLHGQFTCEVQSLAEDRSSLGAYCNPKGRVLAIFRLLRKGDAWLLRLPEDIYEATRDRLAMYRLRAAVEIEDARPMVAVMGLGGEGAAEALGRAGLEPPPGVGRIEIDDTVVLRVPGEPPRFEVYTCPSRRGELWAAFSESLCPGESFHWHRLDLLAGLPIVHHQTAEAFVPHMLNLPEAGAISFTKGCYVGQEIVSRMEHLGAPKRRAFLARGEAAEPIPPGEAIVTTGEGGPREVGTVLEGWPSGEGGADLMAVIAVEAAADPEARLATVGGLRVHDLREVGKN